VFRRFSLYLLGVGLGVIVSMFFFGDRDLDFSYFPNARTIKHLRGQEFAVADQALCQLKCVGFTSSSFEKIFNSIELDVDFGASDVSGQCRTYVIEVEDQQFSKFIMNDCDSLTTLLSVDVSSCECM